MSLDKQLLDKCYLALQLMEVEKDYYLSKNYLEMINIEYRKRNWTLLKQQDLKLIKLSHSRFKVNNQEFNLQDYSNFVAFAFALTFVAVAVIVLAFADQELEDSEGNLLIGPCISVKTNSLSDFFVD